MNTAGESFGVPNSPSPENNKGSIPPATLESMRIAISVLIEKEKKVADQKGLEKTSHFTENDFEFDSSVLTERDVMLWRLTLIKAEDWQNKYTAMFKLYRDAFMADLETMPDGPQRQSRYRFLAYVNNKMSAISEASFEEFKAKNPPQS